MRNQIDAFEWDEGNWPKCNSHGVAKAEIEKLFQSDIAVFQDPSSSEQRLRAIGKTEEGRHVFIVFTLRAADGRTLLRPISARYMHEKEIRRYEQG